jgi:uncharacterized membrane protein
MSHVLLAGESWSTTSIHAKGFDTFTTTEYQEGGDKLIEVLRAAGHEVTYQPAHVAAVDFPASADELAPYDVVLLSDVGANTLLLPPRTFVASQPTPNRLEVLRDWTLAGGGFGMIGGYLTFQGIEAKANYRNTVLADVLPVDMEAGDDREETPQGIHPVAADPHPITDGVTGDWPALLGYQRLVPRAGATVAATVGADPLVVAGTAGEGRTLAYASDIGPHWAPEAFTAWAGFATLWDQAVRWLAGD